MACFGKMTGADLEKQDFKKQDKALYSGKSGRWDTIEVPELLFLMVDGEGDPNGASFAGAISALYPLAYALKFKAKADGKDFVVPPLEAQWWANDPSAFVRNDRASWRWTAMLRIPSFFQQSDLQEIVPIVTKKLAKKGVAGLSVLADVRLAGYSEGTCLQTLHVGPYSAEAPVLADKHDRLMPEKGLTFNGPHHEIYLSDARRVAAEKLRTLLRQPVRPS